MQIADLKNQMYKITDMEGVNTEMQQGIIIYNDIIVRYRVTKRRAQK